MADFISDVLSHFTELADEWKNTAATMDRYGLNGGHLEAARKDLTATIDRVRADYETLSIDQYAVLQRVHPRTVERWIAAGELAAVETAKGWRIRRTAIRQKPQ